MKLLLASSMMLSLVACDDVNDDVCSGSVACVAPDEDVCVTPTLLVDAPVVPNACAGVPGCPAPIPGPPSITEWIGDSDFVVIGTVAELAAVESPAAEAVTGGAIISDTADCNVLQPATSLMLTEISILYQRGDTALVLRPWCDGTESLSIRIGDAQTLEWLPTPHWRDGELTWLGLEPERLVPGQRLGVLLYDDRELGLVVLSSEILFQVSATDVVHLVDVCPYCGPRVPEDLNGLSVTELRDSIAAAMDGVASVDGWFRQRPAEERLRRYISTCWR